MLKLSLSRIIITSTILTKFKRNLVLALNIMNNGEIRKRNSEAKIVRAYFEAVKQWEKELRKPVNSKK